MDEASLYLAKAEESLAGAESEFANHRYNNCANRAYYASFQAAIAALVDAGIRPTGGKGERGHAFVQAQFVGLLINRRKAYPSGLRDVLGQALAIREQGDYLRTHVSERLAARSLISARSFLTAVVSRREDWA